MLVYSRIISQRCSRSRSDMPCASTCMQNVCMSRARTRVSKLTRRDVRIDDVTSRQRARAICSMYTYVYVYAYVNDWADSLDLESRPVPVYRAEPASPTGVVVKAVNWPLVLTRSLPACVFEPLAAAGPSDPSRSSLGARDCPSERGTHGLPRLPGRPTRVSAPERDVMKIEKAKPKKGVSELVSRVGWT